MAVVSEQDLISDPEAPFHCALAIDTAGVFCFAGGSCVLLQTGFFGTNYYFISLIGCSLVWVASGTSVYMFSSCLNE